MRPPRVVPQEPVYERLVEGLKVVGQKISMLGNEGFREGAVEPLNLALHFGSSRIAVKVDDALIIAEGFEMILEFRPVVRLDVGQ